MPKGTSAPGNWPTGPGSTGPVPVPSSGWTRAAGSVPAGGAPEAGDARPAAIAVVTPPSMENIATVTTSAQRLGGPTARVIAMTEATGTAGGRVGRFRKG